MKRRFFISLSALSAVPLAARAADDAPEPDWHETVNREGLKHRAVSEDGKITLQVELILPAEDDVTEAMDEKGEFRAYQYKGKDQPYPFHPGSRLLTCLLWAAPRRVGRTAIRAASS